MIKEDSTVSDVLHEIENQLTLLDLQMRVEGSNGSLLAQWSFWQTTLKKIYQLLENKS